MKINFQAFDLPTGEEQCVTYVKLRNYRKPKTFFYCGSSLPPEFISSGNEMEVAFKAYQNKGKHKGFLLNYLTFQESNNFITSSKSRIAGTLTETGVYV